MTTVELIYDDDCPNVGKAREQLMRAFAEAGLPAQWVEWERKNPSSPEHVHAYGSPTILIDGKDVAGAEPSDNISCCRLYVDANGGFKGAPSVEMIATALRGQGNKTVPEGGGSRPGGWRISLATLPGIGASLLPIGVCPACWPAYVGLLSSLGLSFLVETSYLLPLTTLFLLIAATSLAYRAKTRRGYYPFVLGLAASVVVLAGKFTFESDPAMYGGIALLVTASLWNAWPQKTKDKRSCPACVPAGHALNKAGNAVKEVI